MPAIPAHRTQWLDVPERKGWKAPPLQPEHVLAIAGRKGYFHCTPQYRTDQNRTVAARLRRAGFLKKDAAFNIYSNACWVLTEKGRAWLESDDPFSYDWKPSPYPRTGVFA